MPFYGREEWDPKLIIAQIVALQAVHYICMGILLAAMHAVFGSFLSLSTLFDSKMLSVRTAPGWLPIVLSLLCACSSAFVMFVVVERSKKCFDFAFTLYFLHFLCCVVYKGFPSSWDWWVVNVICLAILAIASERLCLRRELSDIDL